MALHFNRGFLEINLRTKEFTTLNTSGPLEHDNKGMQKAGGAFWALGPTPPYQLPSPLRSGPPRHTARSQGERWVFTPSGKASWALHNPYNHSYSHVSVVPEASLSIYRAQATISQDFSIFSPPTIEINTWRLKSTLAMGTHLWSPVTKRRKSHNVSQSTGFFFYFLFLPREFKHRHQSSGRRADGNCVPCALKNNAEALELLARWDWWRCLLTW